MKRAIHPCMNNIQPRRSCVRRAQCGWPKAACPMRHICRTSSPKGGRSRAHLGRPSACLVQGEGWWRVRTGDEDITIALVLRWGTDLADLVQWIQIIFYIGVNINHLLGIMPSTLNPPYSIVLRWSCYLLYVLFFPLKGRFGMGLRMECMEKGIKCES